MYALTGSPFLLGLLGLCRSIPALTLSSIAGVVVDRVDQRRVLMITQTVAALSSLSLGTLVITGHVQFWHVYIEVVIQSVVQAFDASARQSLFPRLLPKAHLTEAVTLYSIGARLSQLVGPALGGLAIAGLGEASPFLLNSAAFATLIAVVTNLRGVVPRTAQLGSSLRGEWVEGLRYMRTVPIFMGLLRMELVFSFFNMNPVMIAIIGREVLRVDPQGLGGLLSAPAVGSLLGLSALVAMKPSRRPGRFLILCTFVYATALVAFAQSSVYGLSFAALVAIGLLDSLVSVTRQNVLHLTAPGRMRGRVMGNLGTVSRGVGPLAQVQSGFLAGTIGGPLAVVCSAVALAVAASLTARTNRVLWRFSRDDALPAVAEVAATEKD